MSIAIIFGIVWALLFSQLWWICENEPSWKTQPRPQCDLGRNVAITQIISEDPSFIKGVGLLMYFRRRFRGLCPYLRSISPHLRGQIVKGAKSPGAICLLCISDHHGR